MKQPLRPIVATIVLAAFNTSAQAPPVLDLQLYVGLTITGAIGKVYSVEYSDLAQSNNPAASPCLE